MKAWAAGIVVAVTGAMSSSGVFAATLNDGNFVLSNCKATLRVMDTNKMKAADDQLGMGQCLGLVEGVRNTLMYLNGSIERKLQICWPQDGIQNGQAVRILVKYLDDHPADLNKDQTLLTMLAFADAYPCK